MKLKIILNGMFFLCLLTSYSQTIVDRSSSVKPIWLNEPPKGQAYVYYTGVGSSDNSIELAKKSALADIISYISLSATQTVQVSSTFEKTENRQLGLTGNENYNFNENFVEVIKSDGEKITINGLEKEEEYWQVVSENGKMKYQYWVLMRTLKPGYNGPRNIKEGYGFAPVWRSAIVPGWGQLYKKEKTKGILILSATAVTVSGIIISQTMYQTNINNAESTHNIDLIEAYLADADTWQTMRNIFSVAAGAIYIYNIVDAITAKGAKKYAYTEPRKFDFAPVLGNNTTGIAMRIRF